MDLLRGAGDSLLAVSLSHAETGVIIVDVSEAMNYDLQVTNKDTQILLISCWRLLTSQSSLRRLRPDSLALFPAAELLRWPVTPGGGAVDRWTSRPSGAVWVEVVEEDVVPLRAPPSVCSAKKATSKSEGFFSQFMTDNLTWKFEL